MESNAKSQRICDFCKKSFKSADADRDLRIKATLAGDKGQNESFDFCNEAHLLGFLLKRKNRTIKAGFDFDFRVKPRKS